MSAIIHMASSIDELFKEAGRNLIFKEGGVSFDIRMVDRSLTGRGGDAYVVVDCFDKKGNPVSIDKIEEKARKFLGKKFREGGAAMELFPYLGQAENRMVAYLTRQEQINY